MADDNYIQILIALHEESSSNARHIQEQRVSMTNFLVTINSAILGFIIALGFRIETLPLSVLICVLGIYGVLASAKFTQHFHRYYLESKNIRHRLDEIVPESKIEELFNSAREQNRQRYSKLERRVRIVYLWSSLHFVFILLGIACILLTL